MRDPRGRTPLILASHCGCESLVKLLLETSGPIDVDEADRYGYTALASASLSGHDGVVKLLLTTGQADVHKRRNERYPFGMAIDGGHEAVVKLFLEPG